MRWLYSKSFVWVIVASGVMCMGFIAYNLSSLGLHRYPSAPRKYLNRADPERGRAAFARYGCVGCHVIPGVRIATGRVGPSLEDIHRQSYIGGVLANTPENMVNWLRDPKRYSPETAMPDLQVSEEDARDMAAYLFAQK